MWKLFLYGLLSGGVSFFKKNPGELFFFFLDGGILSGGGNFGHIVRGPN